MACGTGGPPGSCVRRRAQRSLCFVKEERTPRQPTLRDAPGGRQVSPVTWVWAPGQRRGQEAEPPGESGQVTGHSRVRSRECRGNTPRTNRASECHLAPLVLGGLQPECRGAGPSLDFDGLEPPVQGRREPLRGRGCDRSPEGAGPCACAHPRVRCPPPTGCARSLDQDTVPPRGASRSGALTSAFPSPGHQGRPLVALRNPGRHPIGGNIEQSLCHRSLVSDSLRPHGL